MRSAKPTVTVFLTQDMSLGEWETMGLLKRELAIYERLSRWFTIQFYSWGDESEYRFEKSYPWFKVLLLEHYRKKGFFYKRIFYKHQEALSKSSLFKTNQIKGAKIAADYSSRFQIPLIVRFGYLLSAFIAKQESEPGIIDSVIQYESDVFDSANAIISSNERDADIVSKTHNIPASKLKIIHNYVDTDHFTVKNITKKKGTILYVGRFSSQKNLISLISAVSIASHVNELIMVGDGELKSELEQKADELCRGKVRFVGRVDNEMLTEYYQTCDAYVLPSLYEGLPKTLLEAMSCGAACVVTNVVGNKEVISQGKNGWLCETDSQSIAKALDIILSDNKLKALISQNARKTIEESYSLAGATESERNVYMKILNG